MQRPGVPVAADTLPVSPVAVPQEAPSPRKRRPPGSAVPQEAPCRNPLGRGPPYVMIRLRTTTVSGASNTCWRPARTVGDNQRHGRTACLIIRPVQPRGRCCIKPSWWINAAYLPVRIWSTHLASTARPSVEDQFAGYVCCHVPTALPAIDLDRKSCGHRS